MKIYKLILLLLFTFPYLTNSQVKVDSGGYSSSFPGVDAAGRNSFPSGMPYLSGNSTGRPVPTNDWWSKLVKSGQADNLFNYPLTMKTVNDGLIVTYIPFGVIGDSSPIKVGLTGLNASNTTVSDYSDWTVTMNWSSGLNNMSATAGIGMPFLYFTKADNNQVAIQISNGNVTISDNKIIILDASNGADFVIFAPLGSIWSKQNNVYTLNENGKNYWSMAMLPQEYSNLSSEIEKLEEFAFAFPSNTAVSWEYNEKTSKVRTTFTVSTEVKEGINNKIYQGLLPHQWGNLAEDSPAPNGKIYSSIRGDLKILEGNTFTVENTFSGILPTLPNLAFKSVEFDIGGLNNKISELENSQLDLWTDSYNEGQLMNRLVQTGRIANEIGNFEARDKILNTIKNRLENWLTYTPGEIAFMFYYDPNWNSLLGYPSGHGQDNNINDHHFHWGYFIHAAAFIEQFEPGWVNNWGNMVNLLIRDAASYDRNDSLFPFLRNFSPFAGHSWANGFASFPQGNDQESTSESMQFASSLIHYGTLTNQNDIRDLGIYIYTTEQSAIDEYWFDKNNRVFGSNQRYGLISRLWGNSYDNGTFWTSDITASYGIELYPIHGGSFYLANDTSYVNKIWNEIEQYTEILNPNSKNPNLWYDTFWKYLAFADPSKAIELYNLSPDRILKFGISDAQTYYWLHSLNVLGKFQPNITADYPIAMAFYKDGKKIYTAHNYSNQNKVIHFSDGYNLNVPAGKLITSEDLDVKGVLSTNFYSAYPNNTLDLVLDSPNNDLTKVVFYLGQNEIGTDMVPPYQIKSPELPLVINSFYAKLFIDDNYGISNQINVVVGEQIPFNGNQNIIPGTIQAGYYDEFEGGKGQNISYLDLSKGNYGDLRLNENVDVGLSQVEGATIGWIDAGEWVEYSINAEKTGYYNLNIRFASGNASGGGPFNVLLDNQVIKENISLSSTSSSNWTTFSTKLLSDLPVTKGKHILRLDFLGGQFNLGKLSFEFKRELDYPVPIAIAGNNRSVILPNTSTILDGSASSYQGTENLSYLWEQIYGPSIIDFQDSLSLTTTINNLVKGVYKFRLNLKTPNLTDSDEIIISVNETGNQVPSIYISLPKSEIKLGDSLLVESVASDLDGSISEVQFFSNDTLFKKINSFPFQTFLKPNKIGNSSIKAKAFDNLGAESYSNEVSVNVLESKICKFSSNQAQQGSFSLGYKVSFETIGSSVIITFELLDKDKTGLVAYLWQKSPFAEFQLEEISPNVFSKTITGLNQGEKLSFACKFAFAGGLAVTNYFDYSVGSDCSETDDTEAPTDFQAIISSISSNSISFKLFANDNSGKIIYVINQNEIEKLINGNSGDTTNFSYLGLSSNTNYNFNLKAKDSNGNISNTIINLTSTTLESSNTNCNGQSNESQQGNFEIGYNYSISTEQNNVIIEFQLLDQKSDVIAYLWNKNPFKESSMTSLGNNRFKIILENQTTNTSVSFAVKFAFAGGLVVTKYFDYIVGDNCTGLKDSDDDGVDDSIDLCPNTNSGIIVDSNGCEIILSLNKEIDDLYIYPNPFTSYFMIKFNQNYADYVNFNLYDLKGIKLFSRKYVLSGDKILVENFSKGTYLLEIFLNGNSEKSQILKLIK